MFYLKNAAQLQFAKGVPREAQTQEALKMTKG